MKTKVLIVLAFFIVSLTPGYSQLNNQKRKKFREARKVENQKKVEKLVESKEFVFEAKTAFPSGGAAVDLTSNQNYIRFSPAKIESYMPFFGRVYSVDFPADGGLKFEGEPAEFQTKKLKDNKGYEVTAKVTHPRDSYDIYIKVGREGTSTLTISSQQRSSISYLGKISALEKQM